MMQAGMWSSRAERRKRPQQRAWPRNQAAHRQDASCRPPMGSLAPGALALSARIRVAGRARPGSSLRGGCDGHAGCYAARAPGSGSRIFRAVGSRAVGVSPALDRRPSPSQDLANGVAFTAAKRVIGLRPGSGGCGRFRVYEGPAISTDWRAPDPPRSCNRAE
jgi:hypothetical protein